MMHFLTPLSVAGTGGGKTYFLLTIIEALLQTNAQLYILDPKNADLADLASATPAKEAPQYLTEGAQFRWKQWSKSLEIPLGIRVFSHSWLIVTIGGKYHTFTIGGMQAE